MAFPRGLVHRRGTTSLVSHQRGDHTIKVSFICFSGEGREWGEGEDKVFFCSFLFWCELYIVVCFLFLWCLSLLTSSAGTAWSPAAYARGSSPLGTPVKGLMDSGRAWKITPPPKKKTTFGKIEKQKILFFFGFAGFSVFICQCVARVSSFSEMQNPSSCFA